MSWTLEITVATHQWIFISLNSGGGGGGGGEEEEEEEEEISTFSAWGGCMAFK
jgi:hypothetical protein